MLQRCLKQIVEKLLIIIYYIFLRRCAIYLRKKKALFFFLLQLVFFLWFSSKKHMVEQLSSFFPTYLPRECSECWCEARADIWGAAIFQLYPWQDDTTTAILRALPQITRTPAPGLCCLRRGWGVLRFTWKRGADGSGLSAMTIEIKALKQEPPHL